MRGYTLVRSIARDLHHGLSLDNKLGYKVMSACVVYTACAYAIALYVEVTR